MSYLSQVKSSLSKATIETSRLMGAHLRIEARKSGWPEEVIRHLSVQHKDGSFNVHAHESHKNQVLNLEYGTPSTQPTAAIRRFGNRTASAESFLVRRTMRHLGGHK